MTIVRDEEVKSRAFYHISFQIKDQYFNMSDGIESPEQILKIVRELKTKKYSPEIYRIISYDRTKRGYFSKESKREDLTIERLEEIVERNEPLPTCIIEVPVFYLLSKIYL